MTKKRKSNELDMSLYAVSSKHFSYDKGTETMSCEASDLGPMSEGLFWMQRIWSDSADTGIAIKSTRTGKVERFLCYEETKDDDGDVQCWEFSPINKIKGLKKVIIFND